MSDSEIAAQAETDYPLVHLLGTTARPHLPYLASGAITLTVAKSLSNAAIFVLGLAFDAVFYDEPFSLPLVPDGWIPTATIDQLWFAFGLLLGVKLADAALGFVGQWSLNAFALRVQHDVRVATFDSAQRLELGFFNSEQTGEVMSVLNNDVNSLEGFLGDGIEQSIFGIVSLLSALAFMALLNWQLALLVIAAVPLVVAVNLWYSKVFEPLFDRVRARLGALNARLETNLSGVAIIKAFTGEDYERGRVEASSLDHYTARWNAARIEARHWPTMRLISGGWLLLAFSVGAFWVINGPPLFFTAELTAGQLIPFLFYMQNLTGPLGSITGSISQYKGRKAAAKRIIGLQDSKWAVDDETDSVPLRNVRGHVEYDDVTFSYPGADENVIDRVSFAVESGNTIAIVGSTGAGKSTLMKLLLRFYRPDSGAVRIDGTDVQEVSYESLREIIGYVDQDPYLLNGTIRENIAYGATDPTEDEIVGAAREARAHEFVRNAPEGYDTEVGERGVKLSGGQRQRIALARAIIGDPAILVLDEATSHVDNETEVLIQRSLADVTENRTTFVIAHRLSTVRDADRILVMDDGELIERGSHDELLDDGGTYATLWHVQVGEIDALPDEFVDRATVAYDENA